MLMSKVSVIIPIYNSEKYISRCLESVLAQTLEDIEIICINDCSIDKSLDIVKDYWKKDKRIVVIDNDKNVGVTASRRRGFTYATADNICFVDADDWIENNMIESLYDIMQNNNTDCVSSGYYFEGDYISEYKDGFPEGLYNEEKMDLLRDSMIFNPNTGNVGLRAPLCTKMYRKALMEKIFQLIPDELIFAEDKMMNITGMLYANSVYILNKSFYHYIKNSESCVNTPKISYLSKVNAVYKYACSLYSNPKFTDAMRLQMEIYIMEMLYKGINSRLGFHNNNLLWVDPYYLEMIPLNSKIIIYGAGDFGKSYYRQLVRRKEFNIVGWVDPDYENLKTVKYEISSPDLINNIDYDYILLAYKGRGKAFDLKQNLIATGIDESKVLWFDQTEFYWKYAEANGFFDDYKDNVDG